MYYRYIWQELRHRPNRTLVNILGVALGVALFISINAVAGAYQTAAEQPFKNIGADLVVQRADVQNPSEQKAPMTMRGIKLPFSNQVLAEKDWLALEQLPEVSGLAKALLLWEFVPGGFHTIMGMDTSTDDLGPMKIRTWVNEGRFLLSPKEVLLEKHFARFNKFHVGDEIKINSQGFNIVGLVEIKAGSQVAAANIYMSLKDAQTLVEGAAAPFNVVYLRLKDPGRLNQVRSEITSKMPGAQVSSSDSFLMLMGGVSVISGYFSLIISLVALFGAMFLIMKTMTSNLLERSQEIGILKAVGWSRRDVSRQLLGEVTVQSLLGGILGIIFGYLMSFALGFLSLTITVPWDLNPLPAAARTGEMAAQVVTLPVRVSMGLAAWSLALSLLTGLLTAYVIGRKASKMKPQVIWRQL